MAETKGKKTILLPGQMVLIDNQYKIISINKGKSFMMFDLINDPGEKNDIAIKNPGLLKEMIKILENWQQSCK